MQVATIAGLLGVALFAILVNSPVEGHPMPEADPEPEPDKSLGWAYEPYMSPRKCPDENNDGGYGGGDDKEDSGDAKNGGGGGGDLLDVNLEVVLAVDLSGLEKLLNVLIKLLLRVRTAKQCEYSDYANKFQDTLLDIYAYINLLGIKVQVNLLVILGPLLEAILGLVKNLLAGILIDVSLILKLVVQILLTLNLGIDVDIVVQLKLLGIDVDLDVGVSL